MLILDARKRVGITTAINTDLYSAIEPFAQLPCLQVSYSEYAFYANDGMLLQSIAPSSVYLHTTNRTNIASDKPYVRNCSIKHVNALLQYTPFIPASVILHYGSRTNLSQVLDSIGKLNIPSSIKNHALLLENAAGEGTELGVTVEEIRHVFEHISNPKIGMCLDTCHAFSAGYHIDEIQPLMLLLDELEGIAPRKLRMIHLNDCKVPRGSRVDRHANLGQGYIWSHDQSSLAWLLDYGADMNIDFILETPDAINDLCKLQQNYLRLQRRR